VFITTKCESSNPAHDDLYSIQLYVIKFVSDLRQVSSYFPGALVSSTNETNHHDKNEILFKVALNTWTLNLTPIEYERHKRRVRRKQMEH